MYVYIYIYSPWKILFCNVRFLEVYKLQVLNLKETLRCKTIFSMD